jgi:CubicO group peptidase (beta-lactamase class C family)
MKKLIASSLSLIFISIVLVMLIAAQEENDIPDAFEPEIENSSDSAPREQKSPQSQQIELAAQSKQPVTNTKFNTLTEALEKERVRQRLVGLEVAALKGNQTIYAHAFGFKNLEKKEPMTIETPIAIASVSKIVTVTQAMILVDQKKIKSLDDPINNYLPEGSKVINPKYPNVPITFRMLIKHTSSISDKVYNTIQNLDIYGKDQPEGAFESLIKDYFFQNGKYYKQGIFNNAQPGTKTDYANTNTALLGYLIQVISGMPFNEFGKKFIFDKLGMSNTGWLLREVNQESIAMPYKRGNPPQAYGHYTFPDTASGGLRTNIPDFSKFILMLMNQGTYNNVQILSPETVTLMLATGFLGNGPEYAHEGSEKGVTSSVVFNLQEGNGAIVFSNTDDEKIAGAPAVSINNFVDPLLQAS